MDEAERSCDILDVAYYSDVLQRSKMHRIKTLRDELTNLQRETTYIQAEKRRIEARIEAFRYTHESCKCETSENVSSSLMSINKELYEVINLKDELIVEESNVNAAIIEGKIQDIQRKLVKEAIKASTY